MADKAVVFAGQGAQFVGMGRDLAEAYPECKELFDRADAALGYSLSKICFEGPESDLTKSNYCQPAIFTVSAACYQALCREVPDVTFAGAAGLSLGEWTALYAAGALSFEDTLRVLEARGGFMQEACEQRAGGMVSILGLDADKVREIAAATGMEVANLNSAEQTVISGPKENVQKVEELAQAAGAKRAIPLNVAGAYHSSLMAPAAEKLAEVLQGVEFKAPAIPVLSNATGAPHGGPDDIRANMLKQVTHSVLWMSCIEWLRDAGVKACVECGPGKVLSGLIRRIDRELSVCNIQDTETLGKAVEAVKAAS